VNDDNLDARTDALVDALAARTPAAMDLGTPQLDPSAPELQELLALGPRVVRHLLATLAGTNARRTAWVVLALGKLGDKRALGPLRGLLADYQARPNKTMWDFAVIGQANTAITLLE
jgi:HEAT repeat protein